MVKYNDNNNPKNKLPCSCGGAAVAAVAIILKTI